MLPASSITVAERREVPSKRPTGIPLGRPTYVEIDLSKLVDNYRTIQKCLPPSAHIMPVIKANAYGHGAVPIAKTLAKEDPISFGVATVEEAIELRRGGIHHPLTVLSGVYRSQLSKLFDYRLTPVLFDRDITEELYRCAKKRGESISVEVKVDTGMGRLGILPCEVEPFFKELLKKSRYLRLQGVLSHLSDADAEDTTYTEEQITTFEEVLQKVRHLGFKPVPHIVNSAGILARASFSDSTVRPGILLYGYAPSPRLQKGLEVEPILSWKTRVLSIREVPKGFSVSYGCSYVTERRTRLGTLPVGYADGYPRALSNRGEVIVRGKRAPVVGRICMDLTMIDLTDIPAVEPGDEVVLIGKEGSEAVTADEIAEQCHTISYEILCGIGKRVPRYYKENG